MGAAVRIAVAGAGLIGRRHLKALALVPETELAAIIDPDASTKDLAAQHGVPWFSDLGEMLSECPEKCPVNGVVLATPNQSHTEGAITCLAHGLPVLVEKPLAHTVEGAEAILAAAARAGIPVLVGHHRRHNQLIERAKQILESGELGMLTAVQGQTWFRKPESYFETEWRQKAGAGPVYLNLIHDIDLLQYLCGRIDSVHAMESNLVRGFEVEETAVVLLRFAGGLLGTVNASDAATAPWSWELTARENAHYPSTAENCYWIGGTKGSLALPNLAVWRHEGGDSWWNPISSTREVFGFEDPLTRQIRQFAAVVQGHEAPVVSGEDGLSALRVIEAIKASAATGRTVAT